MASNSLEKGKEMGKETGMIGGLDPLEREKETVHHETGAEVFLGKNSA